MSKKKIKVEMCVHDAMAAILNNLHILKMLKVSHLAPHGFGISTFILKRNHPPPPPKEEAV